MFDETETVWAGSLDLTVETSEGEAVITGTFADLCGICRGKLAVSCQGLVSTQVWCYIKQKAYVY